MKCKVTVDTSHYPKEGPWDLPEGWMWTTIDFISESILYGVSESARISGEYKLLRITDIQNGRVDWSTVPFSDYDCSKANQYLLQDYDILFARTGATVGKSFLSVSTPPNVIYASYLIRVRPNNKVLPQYVKYYFESGYYWEQISINSIGVGQPNVNGSVLSGLTIPIPPYAEQERIVASAETILNLVDAFEGEKETLLQELSRVKSRILDLAIHGKLVPQDLSDEPAIEILKQINPNFKPSDNLHYEGELPNGWYAITLGQVVDIISGTSYHKSDIVSSGTGIRILRGGNIQNGRILLCDDDVYVQSYLANERNALCLGDIVIVASTGSHELIGKAAQVDTKYPNTQIGAFLRVIRPRAIELANYLGVIFQSNYYKNHIRDVAKGTNINNIKSAYLTEFVVPIPPLEEQRRILQRINALFVIADQITDSIDDTK